MANILQHSLHYSGIKFRREVLPKNVQKKMLAIYVITALCLPWLQGCMVCTNCIRQPVSLLFHPLFLILKQGKEETTLKLPLYLCCFIQLASDTKKARVTALWFEQPICFYTRCFFAMFILYNLATTVTAEMCLTDSLDIMYSDSD